MAFDSERNDLVPGDNNYTWDVFVRDLSTSSTRLVSVDSAENQKGDPSCCRPSISADGHFVAFSSGGELAFPSGGHLYVRDLIAGKTEAVALNSAGYAANFGAEFPAISGDGRYVAFESFSSNLVSDDTNGDPYSCFCGEDVFLRDRLAARTIRVSVDASGRQANDSSWHVSISGDGRYVAFVSKASNLVPDDTNQVADIFVHDTQTEATVRVSVGSSGEEANDYSVNPAISADGRYVTFESYASNLVAGDTNHAADVFLHDLLTGETTRVSVDSHGGEGKGPSYASSISGDGRYVSFTSAASNLVFRDADGWADVFVYDRLTGVTNAVSVDQSGETQSGMESSISGNGQRIAFVSAAGTYLSPQGVTGRYDVYVRDQGPETCGSGRGRESGYITSRVHDSEDSFGPAKSAVHLANCDILVPQKLDD